MKWHGLAAGALACLLAAPVSAKIDLVTLPGRDATELTIYNSADLTLVRETRTLSFNEGMNEIQFSWANTLIDPTSLRINVDASPELTVIDTIYPAGTSDLAVWNIEAKADVSAPVEISYFCSGLSWSADYVVKANQEETEFSLQQFITVRNNSGEDFENAATRVVLGEINLVDAIAKLAKQGMELDGITLGRAAAEESLRERQDMFPSAPRAMAFAGAANEIPSEAKAIIKQAVSEYYLFAVEGKEDIENGWGKELPNPVVADIPFDLSYEIDPQKYGMQAVKFYKLKNTEDHELGDDPMPSGPYYVYTDDGRGGLRFENRTNEDYVPVGEDIELNLGSDGLVLYEERIMDSERINFERDNNDNITGWVDVITKELEIRNSRNRTIPLKLTHRIDGEDWRMRAINESDYEQLDRATIRWERDLEPESALIIEYTVEIARGTASI